jgi:hypothetical protein
MDIRFRLRYGNSISITSIESSGCRLIRRLRGEAAAEFAVAAASV